MAMTATSLNQEARVTNYEKLVSALVASSGGEGAECLPVLTCCCGSCVVETKNRPVFIDTRGHYGQIVPNYGMVHIACIREHGVVHMCTKLPLCDLCHARRKIAAMDGIAVDVTREKAIADAITEYAARAAEFKAAVTVHKEEADEFAMPAFEPGAKRFQTCEAPSPGFAMPGMAFGAAPASTPAPAPAPAAFAFSGMKVVDAPKISYPIATSQPKPQSGQPMTIRAKFNSKCAAGAACKVLLQIEAGEQVVWVKPVGVYHVQCHQA